MVALMALWLSVQIRWKKDFVDFIEDEDVLADRMKCGNCDCQSICTNKK